MYMAATALLWVKQYSNLSLLHLCLAEGRFHLLAPQIAYPSSDASPARLARVVRM